MSYFTYKVEIIDDGHVVDEQGFEFAHEAVDFIENDLAPGEPMRIVRCNEYGREITSISFDQLKAE
jgi:hypothetical protein